MGRKIVVIGGGAAGNTAAQFAKKTDRNAEVTIFEKGKYPQYSKCALPYFISGKVSDVIEFSEKWFEKAGIDLHLETEVKDIDMSKKIVVAEKNGEHIEKRFDALVIATGAKPVIPPIEGVYDDQKRLKEGIFTLRELEDAEKIKHYLKNVRDVTIVGAGLIGLELAEAFHELEKNVRVVEIFPRILPSMVDVDISEKLHEKIKDKIEILTEHKVKRILGDGKVEAVTVENREGKETEIDTDMVIIATGVKPNTYFAEKIGCKLGEHGGILVDENSGTSVKDVYACGDCTEYFDLITRKTFAVGLGSIGVRQGIVAGINAAGGGAKLPKGFLQARTTKIFGVEIAAVGPVSENLENSIAGKYTGKTLSHYFLGGDEITVKIMIDENGRIVASQAIGTGSALRINTLTCAIQNGMKIDEFARMETAYAPPIAPTLDPIVLAADVARYKYERRR